MGIILFIDGVGSNPIPEILYFYATMALVFRYAMIPKKKKSRT